MIATARPIATTEYRGRFAPTPSGPLHLGSLLTALAGYLDARQANGRWLIRIDDLDTARCLSGADSIILKQLESHGLEWDETPVYQSSYQDRYEARLNQLIENSLLYACTCTRAQLGARSRAGPDGPVYDGHCRELHLPIQGLALRFCSPPGALVLHDRVQGVLHRDIQKEIGDFVVRRRDGIAGYQLACTLDEQALGITHIVRGADLLGSSFCQTLLMRRLSIPEPNYAHLPVLLDASGAKLSKQNHAPAIDSAIAGPNLWQCLSHLQQDPPFELLGAPPTELLAWAVPHWSPDRIPAVLTLRVESPG